MDLPFQYALLSPSRAVNAAEINAFVFARRCFGIEVTEPELAENCIFGNLDPQHLGGRPDVAAIVAALSITIPPVGSTLVTIRPDADAYGAMAVLTLRACGRTLSLESQLRIEIIGKADSFSRGAWPGPQPLFPTAGHWDQYSTYSMELEKISAAIADRSTPIENGVETVMNWIESGTVPIFLSKMRSTSEELRLRVDSGALKVYEIVPRLAVVSGSWPALTFGYRLAPVVVAVNPTFKGAIGGEHRKITIAQYEPGWVNLPNVLDELSLREHGWGGSATIIGSPQGIDCTTSLDDCVGTVIRHLATV